MSKDFPELKDLPKITLVNGKEIKLGKPRKIQKSRRGARFNGKHND